MGRADLVATIRSSESTTVWMLAATVCRGARRVSRHRSRWSSRLGYALERLERARDIRRDRPGPTGRLLALREPQRRLAARLRDAQRHEHAGNWAAAAAAYQELIDQDGSRYSWWYELGRCRWRDGDLPEAVAALDQAVRLGGESDPRPRLTLADIHHQTGRWADAQQVLRDNAARHPDHAPTHRRMGEVSLTLARWGGSFTGRLPADGPGTFRFHDATSDAVATARAALERAAALAPAKTTWRPALAEARLADGDLRGAAALYEAALRSAEESTGRWVFAVRQRWQFALEQIYHRLGEPRVVDPLFDCAVADGAAAPPTSPVTGLFEAAFTFGGLTVAGVMATHGADHVEIRLNGRPLRTLQVSRDAAVPQFSFEIKRTTLASFPRTATMEVRCLDGTPLLTASGAAQVDLRIPHGDGSVTTLLASGRTVDKKGTLSLSPQDASRRQRQYLELYARARDVFDSRLGRDLFLLYGTLLGYHRDGDFIAGDDDVDVGYVSDHADPVSVKEETKRVVVDLVRAGFTVSFNRKGRLFRLHWDDGTVGAGGPHLDVRPVWFQGGRVWLHNHCSFPACRQDFLPVEEGKLQGVPVLVPRDTEKFLRGHYGPGWRVPDPGFTYYPSEIDPAVLDHLGRALISAREYRSLAERVRRDLGTEGAARLISVGSRNLYPLEQFLP